MIKKPASTSLSVARSIAMGVLLSMFFFYGIHVTGKWSIENYRPDPETTSTVLLHNECAVLGGTHTLRPNTDVSVMSDGIDGTKLTGSFMNFADGHVGGMAVLSLLFGGVVFAIRKQMKKNRQSS